MKTTKLFVAAVIAAVFFTGCAREGCTDPKALNYDAKATESSGLCKYPNPKLSFFTSSNKYTEMDIYVDGDYKGQLSRYFTSGSPECEAAGTLTIELTAGEHAIYADALNENGDVVKWDKKITIPKETFYCNTFLIN